MKALRFSTVMPVGVGLDDERGDAALVARRDFGHARHDDEQVGDDAVGGPQLDAVEDVVVAVRARPWCQPGRVGADVGLGEQERGDVACGAARQEPSFCSWVPKSFTGWGTPIDWWADSSAPSAGARSRPARAPCCSRPGSGRGRRTSRSIFMPNAPSSFEAVDDLVGDPGLALDQGAVDFVSQNSRSLARNSSPRRDVLGVGARVRVDQVEAEAAEEQLLGEAGLAPVLFAGGLGDLARFALGDVGVFFGADGADMGSSPRVGYRPGAACSLVPRFRHGHQPSRTRRAGPVTL